MKQRTISAIVMLILLVASLILNNVLFEIAMLIIALLGFNEFFNIKYNGVKIKERLFSVKFLGMLSLIFVMLNNVFYRFDTNVIVLLPLLMLSLPIVLYNDNSVYSINDFLYVLGIIYFLGLSFGNIIWLRDTDVIKCIFIFIIAFITDTYAYIGGSLIGRHKLTTISPKKTIEGSIIGTLMGTLIGTVYYYNLVGNVTLFKVIAFCFVLTILSEIGDLIFSSIKRYFNKKDYSNLIPGHGGILDRFDSVIYVSLGLSLILSIF